MTKKRIYKRGVRLCAALLLMSTMALSGCSSQDKTASADEAAVTTQSPADVQGSDTVPPTSIEAEKPGQNSTQTEATSADLYCHEFAAYSGAYVEDGKNEEVKDVAMMLVENKSTQYLDQATVRYIYGNKYATFVVTGLPAGAKCWVMEKNKLTLEEGHTFYFDDCVSSFKSDVIQTPTQLQVDTKDNTITIENTSPNTLENVCVYYKNTFSDGSYLGGITYMVSFGTMEPGDTICKESGHLTNTSKIVRYSYQV